MASTNMTPTSTGRGAEPLFRQVIQPSHVQGSFVADDTDNHDFRADGRGKGRMTVAVDNPANKNLVITVYGTHSLTGDIGDGATKQIGSWTVTAANGANDGYETVNDPFPFYIVRAAYAVAPDDAPLKTTTIYVNFQSV